MLPDDFIACPDINRLTAPSLNMRLLPLVLLPLVLMVVMLPCCVAAGVITTPLCMTMDMKLIMSLPVLMRPMPRLGSEGETCSSSGQQSMTNYQT